MDTARVDICYRPLRIVWAIQSGDKTAFRRAVRLTHTLWGGRYNPIVMADHPEEAGDIVELFRADMIVPIGEGKEVREFPKQFPHLLSPLFPDTLFLKDMHGITRAHVLDIHNALIHWRGTPDWKVLDEHGIRRITCEPDDPLADALLCQYGDYPDAEESGINYHAILSQATLWYDCKVDKESPISLDVIEHPSLGYLARHGLRRHHTVRAGWDYAGFFSGDAGDLNDLVCFWNLRAADISLHFIDPAHMQRYALLKPEYEKRTLAGLANFDEHRRKLAIWSRSEDIEGALKAFSDQSLTACRADGPFFWKGGAIRPPMMVFGDASTLGVFGKEQNKPKVSFSIDAKPFCGDAYFMTQQLVASVTVSGDYNQHSFHPPYVPEWNEFFAREMYFSHNKLRIEPGRIGIVIDAADHTLFLYGLPVSLIVEQLFQSIGFRAKLSSGGLIARQLISRVGGLQGGRVFKIPGVRRLLKTYGPRDTFTKNAALALIGQRDPDNPQGHFENHKHLYIEPRPHGSDLTPQMVFAYLVEKELFRIGAELMCPACNLASWIALDVLKQENTCELCGSTFNATRQLVNGVFHYRRTGVLGLEKNTQGAVPVAMMLQQLDVNLKGALLKNLYAPSYDLVPEAGVDLPTCEIDFIAISPDTFPAKTQVILGECKDQGGTIDANDIENLRRIADALSKSRFEVYVLLAKLAPFDPGEIALARSLNGPHQRRAILLTARELEPYHIYERTEKEVGMELHCGSFDDLAAATARIYFQVPDSTQQETARNG